MCVSYIQYSMTWASVWYCDSRTNAYQCCIWPELCILCVRMSLVPQSIYECDCYLMVWDSCVCVCLCVWPLQINRIRFIYFCSNGQSSLINIPFWTHFPSSFSLSGCLFSIFHVVCVWLSSLSSLIRWSLPLFSLSQWDEMHGFPRKPLRYILSENV